MVNSELGMVKSWIIILGSFNNRCENGNQLICFLDDFREPTFGDNA